VLSTNVHRQGLRDPSDDLALALKRDIVYDDAHLAPFARGNHFVN